jgi:hypothetical protein
MALENYSIRMGPQNIKVNSGVAGRTGKNVSSIMIMGS